MNDDNEEGGILELLIGILVLVLFFLICVGLVV